ncbi:MAG TPA: hypothetical protein PLQ76_01630 [bacterium]|nr:hypothetical protein [bacterium]
MKYYFRTTSDYYPGSQRMNLFADHSFRKAALIIVTMSFCTFLLNILHNAVLIETGNMIKTILIVYPLGLFLLGGASKRSWAWFAGFCILFASGQAPLLLGLSAWFALFFMPAALCLYMFLINERDFLFRLGYSGKRNFAMEILFSILLSTLTITLVYYFLTRVGHFKFTPLTLGGYLIFFMNGIANYFIVFGFTYGIMTRRLLGMRYEPSVLIVINILFMFVLWFPSAVGSGKILMGLLSIFSVAVVTQLPTGMAFFFCRSTRMVLFSYLAYYLFLKSMPILK